ncbi:PQQ-binding-like beta-propeller repeat protein [bacterium]|nr:PQQ-binding-like beta-propeller repeat protein [bacterium]
MTGSSPFRPSVFIVPLLLLAAAAGARTAPDSAAVTCSFCNPTFLGGVERNFYGNLAPDSLSLRWKRYLGSGVTNISSRKGDRVWSGSGWTGQPLLYRENGRLMLLIGAFDYHLKKIDADSGRVVWEYAFDDVIKGTGTLWHNPGADSGGHSLTVLQGSRRGYGNNLYTPVVPSFRSISCDSGAPLWQLDVWRTDSYSRDMDGSPVIINDTAYAGLENGMFISFDPDPAAAALRDGLLQPKIHQTLPLYEQADIAAHGGNLVTESSPCLLGRRLYITAGSGRVYGYSLDSRTIDWEFFIGSDMDGSPVVTEDSCILVPVEKQYIDGHGGLFKLDPSRDAGDCVEWYFPVGDRAFASWQGGLIGSACVNHQTKMVGYPSLAACAGIDGYLYVLHLNDPDRTSPVKGPNLQHTYAVPRLAAKYYIGPSISTPIMVGNKLIAAGYGGIYLFTYDTAGNLTLVDHVAGVAVESTPVCHDRRLYIGCRDGYLYCYGNE